MLWQLQKKRRFHLQLFGNGTNMLVKDGGIRGIVIKPCFDTIEVSGEVITAGAGVLLSKVCAVAYENELSGLEFACRDSRKCWWSSKNECRSIWCRYGRSSAF